MVQFKINGEGQLAGVGNGTSTSLERYQQSNKKTYEGKCLIVIKSIDKNGIVEVVKQQKKTIEIYYNKDFIYLYGI